MTMGATSTVTTYNYVTNQFMNALTATYVALYWILGPQKKKKDFPGRDTLGVCDLATGAF